MTQAKHTPGPWKIEADEGFCTSIVSEDGDIVCQFDQDPSKADGQLLETAPELLEVLVEMWEAHAGNTSGSMSKKVLDAIAKATGQT